MKYKKLLALLLSVAMVFTLVSPVMAADEEPPMLISKRIIVPEVAEGDLVILHTNDIHTHIDGDIRYSHIAGLKDHFEALGADVLLVDSGDHIQGTAYGSMDNGETIIELMNAAGYDLATLGNHEFDYGMDGAMNAMEWAEFEYISCNFYHEQDGVVGDTVLAPYKVFAFGDKKYAFVGVTTPETFTSSTPAYFQDEAGNYIYGIAAGQDGQELYTTVQNAVDAAKEASGNPIVFVLGHLGVDESTEPWRSSDVMANTEGIAIFFDGHSHTQMVEKMTDKNGQTAGEVVQTGEYLNAIGVTVVSNEAPYAEFYLVGVDELAVMGVQQDPEVKLMEESWMAEVDAQLDQVIGYAAVTLDNYAADGTRLVRTQATNAGAFTADALYYLFDNMGMDVDVAIMNGGGIRNDAISGQLTYKDLKEMHPFGNVACLITVSGQQILDALEWGARDLGESENGAFLHASGLVYSVDTTISSTVQQDDKGVWIGGPTGAYRVKDVMICSQENGETVLHPLDVTASYNLAGYNYTLRDLGDGFAMFNDAVNVLDYVMEDYMVLANFVQSFPIVDGLPTVGVKSNDMNHPSGFVDYSDINMPGRVTVLSDATVSADQTASTTGITYEVVSGDTLWSIAEEHLGSGFDWNKIYEANKAVIKTPNMIYVGQNLLIPAA